MILTVLLEDITLWTKLQMKTCTHSLFFTCNLQNRQNYTQLLGDGKAPAVNTPPARVPGKGKGKGEPRPAMKENKLVASAVKERASNKSELLKAFITKFVRLNGILFTRTRLVLGC